MNKVISWGRWPVAAVYVIIGLSFLWVALQSEFGQFRRGDFQSFYPLYEAIIWSTSFLLCAWGILKWRRWAYVLALALAICGLLVAGLAFVALGENRFSVALILPEVFVCSTLFWLLLPTVRAEYWRKEQES